VNRARGAHPPENAHPPEGPCDVCGECVRWIKPFVVFAGNGPFRHRVQHAGHWRHLRTPSVPHRGARSLGGGS